MCDLIPNGAESPARPSTMTGFKNFIRSALVVALTQSTALLAAPVVAIPVAAQASVQSFTTPSGSEQPSSALSDQKLTIPFGVGERMDYEVRYLGGKKGEGSMEVKEIVDVRGRPSWHTVFSVKGKVAFLISVDIKLESWFDVATMQSLRFHQDQRYTNNKKIQNIEIYPERGMYKEDKLEERVTVKDPLDDGSFLYFVRSVPLVVGQEYSFQRYYKPDKNPVKIKVVRRETVKTPAGEFKTLVLKPEIKSGGLFAEGKAEVWITDDAARMVVKLESELPVGTLSLWLTKYKLGTPMKP